MLIFFFCSYYTNAVKLDGIPPDQHEKVLQLTTLSCDDNTLQFPISFVNDDFCDCNKDGSDEPGTSACSHTSATFYCKNDDFVSKWIPTSHVNDGLCDCCDGSDENASSTVCVNTCVRKAEAHAAEKAQARKAFEAGEAIRTSDIQDANTALSKVQVSIVVQEEMVAVKQSDVEAAAVRLSQEETVESSERDGIKAQVRQDVLQSLGIADLSLHQVQSLMLDVVQHVMVDRKKLLELIGVLRANADLPSTALQVAYFKYEEKQRVQKEQQEADQDAKEEAYDDDGEEEEGGREDEDEKEDEEVVEEVVEVGPEPVLELLNSLKEVHHSRPEAQVARDEHTEAESALKTASRSLQDAQGELSTDFGPDRAYYALKEKCFSVLSGQYTYEMCFFGKASQDTTVSLGTWKGFLSDGEQVTFTNGDKCWNGPARSFTLTLFCGDTVELYEIDETATCVYVGKMRVPAACDEAAKKRLGIN